MTVKIGDLVREKEGKRFGGVIVKEEESKVRVQWSDGTNKLYEKKFLESIKPHISHTRYSSFLTK
jgi:hypothetical protein